MNHASPIAIFGAGGKTGTEILRHANRRGLKIRAFEHNLPEPADRVACADYFECDVLADSFAEQLEGCSAVISALGVAFSPSTALDPPPLYTDGTRNILRAMQQADIRRIAVISAAFVVHQPSVPTWFDFTARPALVNVLEQMRAMETMLAQDEGIDWTAARPGWLLDEPYTGEAVIADQRLAKGCFRCRHADLAASLLDFMIDDTWVNAKPAIGKPEAAQFEGIGAVTAELGQD
ncbi:MAG: NAD(P)H-binding protein [Alteripontixanthobacter sp.]